MNMPTLVTGGVGYLGICVVDELLAAGSDVRVLDVLLHGQEGLAAELESRGVTVVRGDVRDRSARLRALEGAKAVVHLAAIVGDPACARDPVRAQAVNVAGARALVEDAGALGVERLVFASTCSNYGRVAEPGTLIDEDGQLAPVSLYAEQKVEIERWLLGAGTNGTLTTCLRLATLYGVAPRMRFDLTVNEFARDLWSGRRLEVFGEQFWRPYVHVRDAARAINLVLRSPAARVARRVFNVGRSEENYRKRDLVEIIRRETDSGSVAYVHREEDPRDYKVSFDRIRRELGYEPSVSVADGVSEILQALEAGRFGDPFDPSHRNVP